MSTHGKRARGYAGPPEEYEWFVRENAIALVAERDAQIERLRERVRRLEQTCEGLRKQLAREREGRQ